MPNLSLTRDWARRESVVAIPSADSVLDYFAGKPGPMERRDFTAGFRVIVGPGGDLDAAYDLLAAQVAPGVAQRLVYQTDSGALWYTIGHNPSIRHTLTAENKGMTAHADFAVTWRIRPDWRLRYSETAEVFHTGSVFVSGSTFGSTGIHTITTDPFPFTVDARGTAGSSLPTIPDTAPTLTIAGQVGGTGGLRVQNTSATVKDAAGTIHPVYFDIPFQLVSGIDTVSLNLMTQTFARAATGLFRPLKPDWQPFWFIIVPGIVNTIVIASLPNASGGLTGGFIKVDWWKKRA